MPEEELVLVSSTDTPEELMTETFPSVSFSVPEPVMAYFPFRFSESGLSELFESVPIIESRIPPLEGTGVY